jgi:hypothetical protein
MGEVPPKMNMYQPRFTSIEKQTVKAKGLSSTPTLEGIFSIEVDGHEKGGKG